MIPARFTNVVFGFLLSGLMTLIVTAITIAQQQDPSIGKWLAAFVTAWPVTFPTVLVVAPIVRRLVTRIMAPEPTDPANSNNAGGELEPTGDTAMTDPEPLPHHNNSDAHDGGDAVLAELRRRPEGQRRNQSGVPVVDPGGLGPAR